MTQCLFGVLRYVPGTDIRAAEIRTVTHAADVGLGIRIGLQNIPVRGADDQEEVRILSHLAEQSNLASPFELTSSPVDDNIEEVFESEFNPPWEANPDNSRIISFLRRVFRERGFLNGSIVIYEKPGVSLEELPRYTVSLGDLEARIVRYYSDGTQKSPSADAIYDAATERK